MNKKIKRIIAREGLILLSLFVASAIAFAGYVWQSTHVSSHIKWPEKGLNTFLSKTRIIDDLNVICPDGKKIKFESKPSPSDMFEACQSSEARHLSKIPDAALLDLANIPWKNRPISQRINFLVIAFFLLLGAYPLYLLVRFIRWAIRTLTREEK